MPIIDFKYKANYYSLLLLGFILPLYKILVPIAIGFFVLTSFINHRNLTQIKNEKRGKLMLLVPIFIISIISLLFATDKSLGWLNIETKLSLLAFPIVFYISKIDFKTSFPSVLKSFVEGCFIASFLVITQAILRYYHSGNANDLLYSKLSAFHHASYFSMYLCFSLVVIYYYSFNPSKTFYIKPAYSFVLIIIFTVLIGLLSSKTGWIVLFLIHLFALSVWIFKHKNYLKGSISIIVITIGSLLLYNFSPTVKNRVSDLFQSTSNTDITGELSSTKSRIVIWNITTELIKERPILGYGCGSSRNVLTDKYKELNLKYLMNKHLNAHNQYLQTALDTGIIGEIVLLFTLLIPLLISIKRKQLLFVFFISIILLNFLTEAMLETQSGVIFYAFFNTLFFTILLQQKGQKSVNSLNDNN